MIAAKIIFLRKIAEKAREDRERREHIRKMVYQSLGGSSRNKRIGDMNILLKWRKTQW